MGSKYERVTVRHKDDIILKLIEVLEQDVSEEGYMIKYSEVEILKWILSIDDETLKALQDELQDI